MVVMKLKQEPFEQIKSGVKIWEVRLNDDKRKAIHIGDRILFKKLPDLLEGVLTKVVDIKHFNHFEDMAGVLSLESVGFGKDANAKTCADVYHTYYTPQEEQEFGVVAFKLELI